jgi:hypothetical protein
VLQKASGPAVAAAQIAAFREWEQDEMIRVSDSYRWPRTYRTRYFSRTRTPDTVPYSSFTTSSPGKRRHSSSRTRRLPLLNDRSLKSMDIEPKFDRAMVAISLERVPNFQVSPSTVSAAST